MKRKPWAIIVLSLLHILAPFGSLLFNAHRAGRSISEHWYFWAHFLPKQLLFIYVVVPIIAGIMIFICRRWSYWVYLACLALVFFSNLYSFSTNMNWMNFGALIAVLVVDLLAVAYFVVPAVRQVYFDPRIRWWEAAPRFVFKHQATVNDAEGEINNISRGGLFIRTKLNLEEGQQVSLEWSYEDIPYQVPGKVVYKSNRAASEGYGVQFAEENKAVKKLCQLLDSRGQMVPERLPSPEDSFGAWLKKLIIKREGLFPKK
ncbi:MAG: PilZ domain-containing protein [Bdellovibrio sp.]|nr:PilZ domain-containing protein [Bdellovibrio sp.]